MRLAFYLDNRAIAGRGPLPHPGHGNPGLGGTEYAALAVVALLAGSALEPLLLLTVPQTVAGVDPAGTVVVSGLADALAVAARRQCQALVFRPGFASPADWSALEHSPLPLLAWLHNLGCHDQARYEALPALRRWLLVSGAQLDAFRHSRLSQAAAVLPNPVAVPPEWRGPRPLAEAEAARDLAYVGAITPFKAFDRLARQWGLIARACPQVRLLVFGGADLYGERAAAGELSAYERHCRLLLERSGCGDRVVFAGSCGLERYDRLHSVAAGVVNPSGRDETFCLSAAEFSACGIPVVAPRRQALIQTVPDGVAGLLAGSDAELARHCITLLTDPQRAHRLGLGGQRHAAEHYGPVAVVAAWESLAQELTRPPRPLPVSTPWWHEQRWLRQLWGSLLALPGWPSWPALKTRFKRLLQGGGQLNPYGIGVIAALFALVVWTLLVFGKYGGNPSGLMRLGQAYPPLPALQHQPLLRLAGKRGNDGQQFLALALDPLQRDSASAEAIDNPIYRGKRMLYPLLAWLLGLGQPAAILWSLSLINVACIGLAAGLVACWSQAEQLDVRWGLAVLALPGYWITLSLSTADLLATTLLLATAVAWRAAKPGRVAVSLAAALLSRETELLAWGATVLAALWQRRWLWLVPVALAPLPLLGLGGWLQHRFAATADGYLATLHFGWPGLGIGRKLAQLFGLLQLPGPLPSPLEWGFDALTLSFWLASLALLLATAWRGWGGPWLRLTAAVYLLPALCTSTQILARFPDYTRVWIDLSSLTLLALLSRRGPLLRWWLAGAGLLSLGYGFGYGALA